MTLQKTLKVTLISALALGLAACGNRGERASGSTNSVPSPHTPDTSTGDYNRSSIWDLLGSGEADQTVQVNRYLWTASLDTLNFLPVQSVDPFTGIIITGYGTPPGGGKSYRATIHIKDPALEARSLSVSLQSRGGPVSASTTRAVEDAILSRARQLRIGDKKL